MTKADKLLFQRIAQKYIYARPGELGERKLLEAVKGDEQRLPTLRPML